MSERQRRNSGALSILAGGPARSPFTPCVLARCDLVRVNDRVLSLAGTLLPSELRSLDAIRLATAERLRGEISEFVTYDDRMADVARTLGHRVAAPA